MKQKGVTNLSSRRGVALRGFSGVAAKLVVLLLTVSIVAGCSSSGRRAPVVERGEAARKHVVSPRQNMPGVAAHEPDWRPQVHVVQRGETLYSIAFNYGLDYHELAELNGIQNPNVIAVGQEIRLFPGNSAVGIARSGTGDTGVREGNGGVTTRAVPTAEDKSASVLVKEQPRLVKYPYSAAAVAQLDRPQEPVKPVAAASANPEIKSEEVNADSATLPAADESDEAPFEWIMPTRGTVIAGFSEAANRKGIDIAGKLGQPIVASAPGKVVYSGSGLRGYGRLVIIKHNSHYLSAYAHNDQVLVKEGQSVARGQKIAVMGDSDADRVKLHFEVRYHGKPVDPAKYLPLDES